jgi:hypothetical protein
MGRGNTTNPHDTDPNRVRKQTPLPVQKARVVDASGMPDDNGFHTVRIKVYGDDAPYDAPVITPMHGSVWVPEPDTDVAVIFAEADKPWVVGAWYAVDRIDSGEVDLPDYEPGDIRVGNSTGAHVTVTKDGNVRIESADDGDVYIDGVKQ